MQFTVHSTFGQTIFFGIFLYKILRQLFWVLQTLMRFIAIFTMTSLSGLVRSPFSKIRINFPCIAKFLQFDMIHKSVGNSNEIHWILMHFLFSFICTVLPSPQSLFYIFLLDCPEFTVKNIPFIFMLLFHIQF